MEIEVYSAGRPSVARWTWLSTGFFLILTAGLAGWMSWGRAGELGSERITPPGWNASFRPPNRFRAEPAPEGAAGSVYAFRLRLPGNAAAEMTVRRTEAFGETPDEVCMRFLPGHKSILRVLFGPQPIRLAADLGPWDGLEVREPTAPMIVRAAIAGDWAYAVTLRTRGAPLDERLYRTFDAVCQSFVATDARSPAVLRRPPNNGS